MTAIRLSRAWSSVLVVVVVALAAVGSVAPVATAGGSDVLVRVSVASEVGVVRGGFVQPLALWVTPGRPFARAPQGAYVDLAFTDAGGVLDIELFGPFLCARADELRLHCSMDGLTPGDLSTGLIRTSFAANVSNLGRDPARRHVEVTSGVPGGRISRTGFDVVPEQPADLAPEPTTQSLVPSDPGAIFHAPLRFRNVRGRTVDGVSLIVRTRHGLAPVRGHDNCRYGTGSDVDTAVCDFPVSVGPDASFEVAGGLAIHVARNARVEQVDAVYRFLPTADAAEAVRSESARWEPGHGPALGLVAAAPIVLEPPEGVDPEAFADRETAAADRPYESRDTFIADLDRGGYRLQDPPGSGPGSDPNGRLWNMAGAAILTLAIAAALYGILRRRPRPGPPAPGLFPG